MTKLKKKVNDLTDKELLEQTLIYKKLCNLVPTKKDDVKTFNTLYVEYKKRNLTKQGETMSKQKETSRPISLPTLCELYGKDPSQLRKMIDKLGIVKIKVRRPDDNRIVTAISDADHQRLVDSFTNLTADKATASDISIAEACKILGYSVDQMSNFTRACANSWSIEIYEKKFNGRTQKCISKKDFKKAQSFRTLVTTEVD